MAEIKTLVRDIQDYLMSERKTVEDVVRVFADSLASTLVQRLAKQDDTPRLRLSNLGTPDRKLWYTINRPQLSEPLPASARLKFLFGDILEEVVLYLAETTGHKVESRQLRVNLHGVEGSIDGLIDGELVDVKSASTYSFRKFAEGLSPATDQFGYLAQLGGYSSALGRNNGYFLVIDKTLGNITLDHHTFPEVDYATMVADKRRMLDFPLPPGRCYPDEPDGKSGNRRLGIACSYCPFKRTCWPGLRVFNYSGKPVFLTRVVREPRVPELGWNDENV